VLCTILWCALAIPGIYFGVQVNNKLGKGDVTGAEAASRKAKLWCIIALIIGLVVNAFLGWLTLAMYKFYQGSMP
jgi:threonine/homoserine efflux transporter RhtA